MHQPHSMRKTLLDAKAEVTILTRRQARRDVVQGFRIVDADCESPMKRLISASIIAHRTVRRHQSPPLLLFTYTSPPVRVMLCGADCLP